MAKRLTAALRHSHTLHREFRAYFAEHPLRKEIIVTGVVNYMLNNGGVGRLVAASKTSLEQSVLAYLKADGAANAARERQKVLESGLDAAAEHNALLKIEDAVESAVGTRIV